MVFCQVCNMQCHHWRESEGSGEDWMICTFPLAMQGIVLLWEFCAAYQVGMQITCTISWVCGNQFIAWQQSYCSSNPCRLGFQLEILSGSFPQLQILSPCRLSIPDFSKAVTQNPERGLYCISTVTRLALCPGVYRRDPGIQFVHVLNC